MLKKKTHEKYCLWVVPNWRRSDIDLAFHLTSRPKESWSPQGSSELAVKIDPHLVGYKQSSNPQRSQVAHSGPKIPRPKKIHVSHINFINTLFCLTGGTTPFFVAKGFPLFLIPLEPRKVFPRVGSDEAAAVGHFLWSDSKHMLRPETPGPSRCEVSKKDLGTTLYRPRDRYYWYSLFMDYMNLWASQYILILIYIYIHIYNLY